MSDQHTRTLLSYVIEPHQAPNIGPIPPTRPADPIYYRQFGNTGIYWPTARDLARARFERHIDEHGCAEHRPAHPDYIGGFGQCEQAMELFALMHTADKVLIG